VPVSIELRAELSTNNVTFDPPQLDFGLAYMDYAYRQKFTVTNAGGLPQEFAFVRLPPSIRIEPSDGFGVLLPYESVDLYAVYKAPPLKPGTEVTNEEGNLFFRVKTGTICAREFKLPYTTQLRFAPVKFSNSKIEFPSMPVGEDVESIITLTNSSNK
jgi:hypothetical protein